MTKILCQPTDCDNCPYPDCIGEIKEKHTPGRKPLPEAERKKRRRERSKRYYEEHKEQHREYYKEYYRKKRAEKNS